MENIEIINENIYDHNEDMECFKLILLEDLSFLLNKEEHVFRLSYKDLKKLKKEVDKHFKKVEIKKVPYTITPTEEAVIMLAEAMKKTVDEEIIRSIITSAKNISTTI